MLRDSTWIAAARRALTQQPLIATRPSLAGLSRLEGQPRPPALLVGVGLCNRDRLGGALPLDLLGMLLPAELLRRAVGAERLVVLVADTHALTNGLSRDAVADVAREAELTLAQVREGLGLDRLEVLRASEIETSASYRRILADVTGRAPDGEHPYFLREVTDIAFLHRRYGGLLKVGWSMSRRRRRAGGLDERAFDGRAARWIDEPVGYVYTEAGRTLDPRRPKAAPYINLDDRHRLTLRPGEPIADKLCRARRGLPEAHWRGLWRYYGALTRTFAETHAPLAGPVPERLEALARLALPARPLRRPSAARRPTEIRATCARAG